MTRRSVLWLAALVLTASSQAQAETERVVVAPRVTLGEVVPSAPEDLAGLDLGPTPPAGSSRLITRQEISRVLTSAGAKPSELQLPSVVRVVTRSQRIDAGKLSELATEAVRAELPAGVTLVAVRTRRTVTVPEGARLSVGQLPKLPKRAGRTKTTATLEWLLEGQVVARAPVAVEVDISEEAARPTVTRGGRVLITIERGPARITAMAAALTDIDTGEVGRFRVESTQKVLRAQLLNAREARVVGDP